MLRSPILVCTLSLALLSSLTTTPLAQPSEKGLELHTFHGGAWFGGGPDQPDLLHAGHGIGLSFPAGDGWRLAMDVRFSRWGHEQLGLDLDAGEGLMVTAPPIYDAWTSYPMRPDGHLIETSLGVETPWLTPGPFHVRPALFLGARRHEETDWHFFRFYRDIPDVPPPDPPGAEVQMFLEPRLTFHLLDLERTTLALHRWSLGMTAGYTITLGRGWPGEDRANFVADGLRLGFVLSY